MDCRDALERLSDHQDGALDSAAAEAVGTHLRECAGCAEAARSLAAVREGLRRLPPVTAPPDLMARVREAVAREGGASLPNSPGAAAPSGVRSLFSRLRIPLEAAAAVLLVASIWWYQRGAPTQPATQSPPAPAGTAVPAPEAVPDSSPRPPGKIAKSPERESPLARKPVETPPPAGAPKPDVPPPASATPGKAEVASLPTGTPEPKARDWSPAELPAAPALRASSESARIVPGEAGPPAAAGAPEGRGGATPGVPKGTTPAPGPRILAAPQSRPLRTLPYGREIVLDVTQESREGAGDRVAVAARRLGGSVERVERDPSGVDVVAVRVLLPEPAAPAFLAEVERIGKVPPEGKPAESEIPAGPTRGTVAYTVRIRVR
jgi:hypothetical protein